REPNSRVFFRTGEKRSRSSTTNHSDAVADLGNIRSKRSCSSTQMSVKLLDGHRISWALLELTRGRLAVNAHKGAAWKFSRASPPSCKLPFRMGWAYRGHRRGPRYNAIQRQISARGNRANDRLCPRLMETGCQLPWRRQFANTASDRESANGE